MCDGCMGVIIPRLKHQDIPEMILVVGDSSDVVVPRFQDWFGTEKSVPPKRDPSHPRYPCSINIRYWEMGIGNWLLFRLIRIIKSIRHF